MTKFSCDTRVCLGFGIHILLLWYCIKGLLEAPAPEDVYRNVASWGGQLGLLRAAFQQSLLKRQVGYLPLRLSFFHHIRGPEELRGHEQG